MKPNTFERTRRSAVRRHIGSFSLALTLLIGIQAMELKAGYSVPWFKVAAGGGTSKSQRYSLSGTIGQPDASAKHSMSGGSFALTGGFWSLYAVQVANTPLLSIAVTSSNTVMVSWPSASVGWLLQENTNSVATSNWIEHPFPQDNQAIKYIIVNPPTGTRFYRLFKPE